MRSGMDTYINKSTEINRERERERERERLIAWSIDWKTDWIHFFISPFSSQFAAELEAAQALLLLSKPVELPSSKPRNRKRDTKCETRWPARNMVRSSGNLKPPFMSVLLHKRVYGGGGVGVGVKEEGGCMRSEEKETGTQSVRQTDIYVYTDWRHSIILKLLFVKTV